MKPVTIILAATAMFAATQLGPASAADPVVDRAGGTCGLLTYGDVDNAFFWPEPVELECNKLGKRTGQWGVLCENAGSDEDIEDCEDAADLTAAESYGYKVEDNKAGDRFLRSLRRKSDFDVRGYPSVDKVQDSAPTLTSVIVVGPKRKIIVIGVYSYRGGQVPGARQLARDAVPRYF